MVSASKSQVRILKETEENLLEQISDPSFLDGSYVILPGQMKRIGEVLADCENTP